MPPPCGNKNVNVKFLIKTNQKLSWMCISCLSFAFLRGTLYFTHCLLLFFSYNVNVSFCAHSGDVISCMQSSSCIAWLF